MRRKAIPEPVQGAPSAAVVNAPTGVATNQSVPPTVSAGGIDEAQAIQIVKDGLGMYPQLGASVPNGYNSRKEMFSYFESIVNREIKHSQYVVLGGQAPSMTLLRTRLNFELTGTNGANSELTLVDGQGNYRVRPSIYIAPQTQQETFSEIASGAFDQSIFDGGEFMVDNGWPNTIWLIGNEADRGFQTGPPNQGCLAAGNPTVYAICDDPNNNFDLFKASYDNIVSVMSSVPGNQFEYAMAHDFPVNQGVTWNGTPFENLLVPNTSEIIGFNTYFKSNTPTLPPYQARWERCRDLCQATGNKQWFSEWGLWTDQFGERGMGDRPDWLQLFWDFCVQVVQDLQQPEFRNTYFWSHTSGNVYPSALDLMPNSKALFQTLWGD